MKKQPTTILYGHHNDPEVKKSAAKLRKAGHKVEINLRPAFDTGTGACGNHLCHCTDVCQEKYAVHAQRKKKDPISEAADRAMDIGQIFGVKKQNPQETELSFAII